MTPISAADLDFNFLIATYGYLAIILGVVLEGEAVVITAGALAYAGLLSLDGVILSAFVGSIGAYHTLFLVGRHQGHRVLERWPKWRARAVRARESIYRHRIKVVLGYRLLYGLRTIVPLMLGMSGLTYRQFALMDVLSATAWSIGVSSLGFTLGKAGALLLERLEVVPMVLLLVLSAVLVVAALVLLARRRPAG